MIDLSIVVPVYNVKEYLKRCIDSILKQTFTNYEVILIDDGSTDGSGDICDHYSLIDKRVKVFHQKNKGLSEARNQGINLSQGLYIAFVDSDDFITKESFEVMIREAKRRKADIVAGYGITYINENNKSPKIKKRDLEDRVYSGIEFLVVSIKQKSMSMCTTLNIYKKELIIKSELRFKSGIYHEDELWTPLIFIEAEKVIQVNIDFYMHYRREGSITQSCNKEKNGIDLIQICYELDYHYRNVSDTYNKKILLDYLVTLYLNGFYIGKLYDKKFDNIIDPDFVTSRATSKKNKFKVKLFRFNKRLYFLVNYVIKHISNMVRKKRI